MQNISLQKDCVDAGIASNDEIILPRFNVEVPYYPVTGCSSEVKPSVLMKEDCKKSAAVYNSLINDSLQSSYDYFSWTGTQQFFLIEVFWH